jgi:hypothetical protein
MIAVVPFESLGRAEHGWLSARHHFSFADYYNPKRMQFGALRVWNDDHIAPGTGFSPHPHRDMEIITYVRSGAISHEDRLGNKGRTEAGDVQVMSAGTGIVHAEYNKESVATEIFQIWVMPNKMGIAPRWDQARFPKATRSGQLQALASGYGHSGAMAISADAVLWAATLEPGQTVRHTLTPGHKAYLVAARGLYAIRGQDGSVQTAHARDGVQVDAEPEVIVEAQESTELLLLDLG